MKSDLKISNPDLLLVIPAIISAFAILVSLITAILKPVNIESLIPSLINISVDLTILLINVWTAFDDFSNSDCFDKKSTGEANGLNPIGNNIKLVSSAKSMLKYFFAKSL